MEAKFKVGDELVAFRPTLKQDYRGVVCAVDLSAICPAEYQLDCGPYGKHWFAEVYLRLATVADGAAPASEVDVPRSAWTPGLPPDSDSPGRKRAPMFAGLVSYFPDALAEEAKVSFEGGQKHTPGEPPRWAREKSTDHLDCFIRHAADYAKHLAEARVAQGTQTPVPTREMIEDMAKVAWRAHAQCQIDVEAAKGGGK